ncbi:carboxy terminal-processing peptidase [Capnocytophaga cynodegmi]|uniref:Carboxyl-terminal processing protease n=1 Tax=Capnocytophaga cynodegmi TaxID=28189 RepID=A0A0B7H5M0_9FLAO|nr:carboxy terminal-processing peptidase [Capnocytophaga cynodegmi]CEN34926.1 Carboxyl-terminal processing protease [Capnocytophaga cynodegmi]CEN36534.1 Carboxyl-terminal processing protease [Capnocytophaga cynodegmi]
MRNFSISLTLLFVSFASCSFVSKKFDDPEKDKLLVEIIQHILTNKHFNPIDVNDDFSKQMYKNYIEHLDSQKRYFLQSDINEFKKYETRLDDDLKNDDLTFFNLTYNRLTQRMKEAQDITKDIFKKPFNFSSKETINTDFEKIPYVKNKAELQKRWERIITFSILSNYITKEKEEKNKKEKDANYKVKSDKELQKEAIETSEKTLLELFSFLNDTVKEEWFSVYVNAMTETFDPHTTYMAPDIKDNFDRDMSGKFEGIGAQLQKKADGIRITGIMLGGPVWKGKLLEVGDHILKVAQGDEEPVDIVGMRLDDAIKLIKGPKGTEVRLTVKRVDGTIEVVPIVRDMVELEETFAKAAIIEDGDKKYGIINLPKFYIDFKNHKERNAASDVALEIEKLKKENIDGLIIDLRNNGGGSLKAVVELGGLFIKNGPIVQVKSPRGRIDVLSDTDSRIQWNGSLVILVNELSASASEILAAAMQDYKRAIVIGGKQTFGKGTVQSFEDLNNYVRQNSFGDLGALKYTIQKFYRINGGSTQLEGVKSDIVVPDKYKYIDVGERDLINAMKWDKIDAVKFESWENQKNFEKAIQNSNKRISENAHLKLIDENAKWVKQQQDKNVFPLNHEAYKKIIEKDEEEAKRFKAISDYKSNLKFVSLPSEEAKIQGSEDLKLRRDRWHETLQQDVYIDEAVNVLKDLNANN